MDVPMALAEWTVLVLLSQKPAHGFAVSQLTAPDGELGRIWRIPRPIVYRAIGRLTEAGLITPEAVEPGLGPQRTIYTVTPQGRQAAEHWLATPVEHVRDIRSQLLVKLQAFCFKIKKFWGWCCCLLPISFQDIKFF